MLGCKQANIEMNHLLGDDEGGHVTKRRKGISLRKSKYRIISIHNLGVG